MITHETLPQALRNLIALRADGAREEGLLLQLAGRFKLKAIRADLARMENAGEITMTPEGFYVLGHPKRVPSDLELKSPDPAYAQPALF